MVVGLAAVPLAAVGCQRAEEVLAPVPRGETIFELDDLTEGYHCRFRIEVEQEGESTLYGHGRILFRSDVESLVEWFFAEDATGIVGVEGKSEPRAYYHLMEGGVLFQFGGLIHSRAVPESHVDLMLTGLTWPGHAALPVDGLFLAPQRKGGGLSLFKQLQDLGASGTEGSSAGTAGVHPYPCPRTRAWSRSCRPSCR